MKKLTVTVELTEEEVESLGEALERIIQFNLAQFQDKKLDVDDWITEYRALLYDLTNVGYHLWLDADNRVGFPKGRHTVDVDAWIKHQKALLKVRK